MEIRSGQFGDTLNDLNLAEVTRLGRQWAEGLWGDPEPEPCEGPRVLKKIWPGLPEDSLEDTSDDLIEWWAAEAGAFLRRQDPLVPQQMYGYLVGAFRKGDDSVKQAFCAWLDRMKEYVTAEDREERERYERAAI